MLTAAANPRRRHSSWLLSAGCKHPGQALSRQAQQHTTRINIHGAAGAADTAMVCGEALRHSSAARLCNRRCFPCAHLKHFVPSSRAHLYALPLASRPSTPIAPAPLMPRSCSGRWRWAVCTSACRHARRCAWRRLAPGTSSSSPAMRGWSLQRAGRWWVPHRQPARSAL